MLMWQFWCALLCVLWLYFLWTRRKFYLLTLKIPGKLGLPIVGMALNLNRENVLQKICYYLDILGPAGLTWLGPIPIFIVSDPQLIQDIFTSPNCVNKAITYKALDQVGASLMSLEDPQWSVHRKLLNPAFGHKVLLSFVPVFNTETAHLLKSLDELVDNGEMDLRPLLQSFTLRIAIQTTMGSDVKSSENFKNDKLLQDYQCLLEAITDMCMSPWLIYKTVRRLLGKERHYSSAKSEVQGFIRKLIESNLAKDTPPLPQDKNIFINLAIDLWKRGIFSLKNVENESNSIVFGAFETTSNTIAYALMLLSMFPEYQEKAFEEILTLFPHTGDFEVTYADTQQMVYLDLILSESMRVIAPVPLLARQTSEDVMLSNGVVLPKGLQILINIFHLHRNKEIWGNDADTFNPDHFLPHNMQDKHPYAYIPFTKGIRNCIGWRYGLISAKVTIAKLLRNYKFTTSFKFEDLVFVEDITMKLKTVPLIKLQRRNE
ncbi:probable cytochrome P450 313a4 [Drosophila innubila]|uniref:probable cytochrome P450 313a4 n=1 Tax=Drosophila innubila TaxID=198719 RepID=UPI00148E788F|nr:probable cytochrome P450 313a4 [Drosophila innubila]